MVEVIEDHKLPIQKRVSDVAVEEGKYSYVLAVSRYGTPYVMTRMYYGENRKYVFMKIDGKDKTKTKKNPHELMRYALDNGYRVYTTDDHLEFYKMIHEHLGNRIEKKIEEYENDEKGS